MRTYEQLRRARYDSKLQKYEKLISAIEDEYVKTRSIKEDSSGNKLVITGVTLDMKFDDDLAIFLSDYMYISKIPIQVIGAGSRTHIRIQESLI